MAEIKISVNIIPYGSFNTKVTYGNEVDRQERLPTYKPPQTTGLKEIEHLYTEDREYRIPDTTG